MKFIYLEPRKPHVNAFPSSSKIEEPPLNSTRDNIHIRHKEAEIFSANQAWIDPRNQSGECSAISLGSDCLARPAK